MSRKIKLFLIAALLAGGIFGSAYFAYAQADLFGLDYGRALGLADADPRVVIINLVRIALTFLGIIAVIIIMYGGWLWMTAAGEAEKVNKAKKVLISAVIGLILILSAFLIVSFIINNIQSALGPTCDPACASGQKCCAGNFCIDNSETCCGTTGCASGLRCCPTPSGPVCAPDCGSLPGAGSFYVQSMSPRGEDVIRNAKIRFTFSGTVDPGTVNNISFRIEDSGGAEIGGERTVSGRQITFVPSGSCPDNPCGAANCFPANMAITATAADGPSGILRLSAGNRELVCDIISGHECVLNFTTGEQIDCERPRAVLNSDPQVCIDYVNELGFSATDDSGISQVAFSDSNDNRAFLFNPDFPDPFLVPCPGPANCGTAPDWWTEPLGTALWQPTIGAGYSAGVDYRLSLRADDLDDNTATATRNFRLRPAHCCDGEQNGDETGIDCGGSCALCRGAACGINLNAACGTGEENCSDERCASGYCFCGTYPNLSDPQTCQDKNYNISGDVCCVCENRPIIGWLSPVGGFCDDSIDTPCRSDTDCAAFTPATCNQDRPNGAPGNFLTIGGRYFGNTPGQVFFSDAAGNQTVPASLANSANPLCGDDSDTWTDTQIIVVVPAGAQEGPVRVVEGATGYNFDDISDESFLRNNILRPGLCRLDPNHGLRNTLVNYYGIRLNNNAAYFGNLTTNEAGLNSNFISDDAGAAGVPDIAAGRTTSFVMNPANINSNFLAFRKDEEAPLGPHIISFEPASGRAGQYVTIYGTGFGPARSQSRVYFGTVGADFNFPRICADSIWTDNQVIVKVPSGLANGTYIIYMDIGSWPRIDTSRLNPSAFAADDSLPLLPSLCRLRPTLGPVGSPASFWGEYFGNQASGGVRFHLNQDSLEINFWDREGDADKIIAVVPPQAVTGPARVLQGGQGGNGMNFRVGTCRTNDECGGADICCPAGTYAEGRCAPNIDECYTRTEPSVYEWDFSTGYSGRRIGDPCYEGAEPATCDLNLSECDPALICDLATCTCQPANLESCGGYNAVQCSNAYFCPNSPGRCSVFDAPAGSAVVTGTCNLDCASQFVGTVYNAAFDRCVRDDPVCSINVINQNNENLTAVCELYDGQYRFIAATRQSCPTGWTLITGNRCVDLAGPTCTPCPANTQCVSGRCASAELCSGAAVCGAGNQCLLTEQDRCECCCRKSSPSEDCCLPLTCEGACGTDASGPDTGTYGLCTGCTIDSDGDGIINPAEQLLSDQACNCVGYFGKFCETGAAGGRGVCRDCAQLGNNILECNLHLTCCADAKNSDLCRGGNGSLLFGGFCPYYNCLSADLFGCDTANPTATGIHRTVDICDERCRANIPPGFTCVNTRQTSVCDLERCSFNCVDEFGIIATEASYPPNCGVCCCRPSVDIGENDRCRNLNPVLACEADRAPCGGPDRGLCCGCTEDSQCGLASLFGCGNDSCCRPRPTVVLTEPADEAVNICRNAKISITFDTIMESRSFAGNIIVFGEYEGICPAGTQYLSQAGREAESARVFGRIYFKIFGLIKKIARFVLPSPLAQAYWDPNPNRNYCAAPGRVSSYQNAGERTILTYSLNNLLDPGRRYFVVTKGDSDLDSENGVKSFWGIGLSGGAADRNIFNGITYNNAYIFSFETLTAQAPNNGVCLIDRVRVDPSSYLFQTNQNSLNENDIDYEHSSFDKVKDSDKVFVALAKSADGQTLAPVTEYTWTWSWVSTVPFVAYIVDNVFPPEIDDRTLLRANPAAVEGRTFLIATAVITDNTGPLPVFDTKAGSANVYLFICANPWPPIDLITGEWLPWLDDPYNCTIIPGPPAGSGCINTNYEIYYCRDAGGLGTADDLPAILSESTVTRGSFNDVLKESYFFREDLPESPVFSVTANPAGTVTAAWPAATGAAGYRIYWGQSSNNYSDSLDVGNALTYIFSGLRNRQTYYFNLTSYFATGAESPYAGEQSAFINDTLGPATPANFSSVPGNQSVLLNWEAVPAPEAVNYVISYGTVSGLYARSENTGDVVRVEFTGLTNGNTYYFVINSVDMYGNRSATSTEISATPSE